ncbi:MAG: 4-hydroxy-tetrahydrodipicolinate reductase, partial [Spirochaetes bacterium]|nr:4-hydroxy-tetrahydrodipicolinate reductase [Spirochaetota bacterium]
MSVKIIVVGASGRVGREIIEAVKYSKNELTGAVDQVNKGTDSGELCGIGHNNVLITDDLKEVIGKGDVIIEFSSPEATIRHLKDNKNNKPLVIGTTGMDETQKKALKKASASIPIVFSPNMSVGVNLLFKLTQMASQVLSSGFDVEIIEAHHRMKKDSPSGTAKKLLEI